MKVYFLHDYAARLILGGNLPPRPCGHFIKNMELTYPPGQCKECADKYEASKQLPQSVVEGMRV